jgi:repressor of nif and glnA expression
MTPINRVAGYSPRSYFQESCTKGDLLINCSEIDERFFNHSWTIVEQVENAQATVGKTDAWVKKEVSEILAESRGILLEIEENLDCR